MIAAMRGTLTFWRDAHDEGGFSLVEVLFATLVLFFVATALLGLAASTTVTAATAKQKNVMTNAVNSYMEEMKALTWDDIGMADPSAGEVPGILSDETTMTLDGYTITIRPSITWVDDPNMIGSWDYKFVHVEVEAAPVTGGTSITSIVQTQVRNTDIGWAWGEYSSETSNTSSESPESPTIAFMSGSPEEMQVVSGTSVFVGADAVHPMENGLLTNMFFYVGAQPMRNAAWEMAQFTINSDAGSREFYWDTTALMDDGVTKITPDGVRTVKVEVWDNIGQQAFRVRRVLVDNEQPPRPGQVTVDWMTDALVGLSWDAVFDGTDPVAYYFVGVDEDQSGWWEHTHDRCGDEVTDISYELPVVNDVYPDGFRRFRIRLYSESPIQGMSAASLTPGIISPPGMTGTWDAERTTSGVSAYCNLWCDFSWDAPKFPVSAVEYNLWRSESADMSDPTLAFSTSDPTTTTFQDHVYTSGKKQSTQVKPYWYQLEVTFVATGPDSPGSAETAWSAVLGPNGTSGSGTHGITW